MPLLPNPQIEDGPLNPGTTVSTSQIQCPAGAANGSQPLPPCFKVVADYDSDVTNKPTVQFRSAEALASASALADAASMTGAFAMRNAHTYACEHKHAPLTLFHLVWPLAGPRLVSNAFSNHHVTPAATSLT
jgi:hypothetical protein